MNDADISINEPSRKKVRTDSSAALSSSSQQQQQLLNIQFEGCPLFLLLELLPKIPQLDDEELLRSVYSMNISAVKKGWTEWFHKVLIRTENNSDRRKIFQATFRVFPELAAQRLRTKFIPDRLPIGSIFFDWPKGHLIPIELLDLLLKGAMGDTLGVSLQV